MNTLFTIGHSNRSVEDFLQLLREFNVSAIADVRSYPKSRFSPQFDRSSLQATLRSVGIAYVFLGNELGARRSEKECYVGGTVDYDLVRKAPAFEQGLARVRSGLQKMTIALMCAERDPITCHRAILIAPSLTRTVPNISHIVGAGSLERHDETERRLLHDYKLYSTDLFASDDELLRNAYKKRGREIAYSEESIP